MTPDSLPVLSTVAAARRIGDSPGALAKAARSGSTVRIRRGSYVESLAWRGQRPEGRHMLLVAAARAAARSAPVFSHESAAAILGIPIVGSWPKAPQATAPPSRPRRSSTAVQWHTSALDDEVIEFSGYLVTSPLRTLLDLAASRPFVTGVVAVDHVLRESATYGVQRDKLLDRIEAGRPFRNANRADAVCRFATGLSGSPEESLSMVRIYEGGYPLPEQQRRFVSPTGKEYFSDFYWSGLDLIGEADGRAKYENPAFLRGRTPQQALWEARDDDGIHSRRKYALHGVHCAGVRTRVASAYPRVTAAHPRHAQRDTPGLQHAPGCGKLV